MSLSISTLLLPLLPVTAGVAAAQIEKMYMPAIRYGKAVTEGSHGSFLLLAAVSMLVFAEAGADTVMLLTAVVLITLSVVLFRRSQKVLPGRSD